MSKLLQTELIVFLDHGNKHNTLGGRRRQIETWNGRTYSARLLTNDDWPLNTWKYPMNHTIVCECWFKKMLILLETASGSSLSEHWIKWAGAKKCRRNDQGKVQLKQQRLQRCNKIGTGVIRASLHWRQNKLFFELCTGARKDKSWCQSSWTAALA